MKSDLLIPPPDRPRGYPRRCHRPAPQWAAPLILLLLTLAPPVSAAGAVAFTDHFQIVGYQTAGSDPAADGQIRRRYRLRLRNGSGAALQGVTAELAAAPDGATLANGRLTFPELAPGRTVRSRDAFSLVMPKALKFDPNSLRWRFHTASARVADGELQVLEWIVDSTTAVPGPGGRVEVAYRLKVRSRSDLTIRKLAIRAICRHKRVQFTDSELHFTDVAAGAEVISTDTLTLRLPSRVRFSPEGLLLAYSYNKGAAILPRRPHVVSLNRIGTREVDADTVEEVFAAEAQNDRHDRSHLRGLLSSAPDGVEIGGTLHFGDVPAGARQASTNCVAIRHDRGLVLDSAQLGWNLLSDPLPPEIPPGSGGVSLPGSGDQPAIDAYVDYTDAAGHEDGEAGSDADGRRVVRTLIDVEMGLAATVGDVNALLQAAGGRIVVMRERVNWITLRIPDPSSLEGLDAVLASARAAAGVVGAYRRTLPEPAQLPANLTPRPDPAAGEFAALPEIGHQLAVRAAAAWNARAAIDYPQSCLPYLVEDDYFGLGLSTNPARIGGINGSAVAILNPEAVDDGHPLQSDGSPNPGHGYHVLGIIAGDFNGRNARGSRQRVTGMFPGSPSRKRLPVLLLDEFRQNLHGPASLAAAIRDLDDGRFFPGGDSPCGSGVMPRIVVNRSLGLAPQGRAGGLLSYDRDASEAEARSWARHVRGQPADHQLESTFFLSQSAGNGFALASADHSGFGRAGLVAMLAPDPAEDDIIPRFANTAVVENRPAGRRGNVYGPRAELHVSSNRLGNVSAIGSLGDSAPAVPLFPGSVTAWSVADPLVSRNCAGTSGSDGQDGVYSFSAPMAYAGLRPDLQARGSDVGCLTGTSQAAAQVTGLALYLAALRPNWPAEELLRHILANAETTLRDDPGQTALAGAPVLDAYAAILSADHMPRSSARALALAPARSAILDVAAGADAGGSPWPGSDRRFDLHDARLYADRLHPRDPADPARLAPAPAVPDYSRYDLNGDGYTGGDLKDRFNLDLDYGADGGAIYHRHGAFDENAVTDFEILCYYVNSPLYSGDRAEFEADLRTRPVRGGLPLTCRTLCAEGGPDTVCPAPRTRVAADFPAVVASAAGLTVRVTRRNAAGTEQALAGAEVVLVPDCADASPAGGSTDAGGGFISTITPRAGCNRVSLAVTVLEADGTTIAAQTRAGAEVLAEPLPRHWAGTITYEFSGSGSASSPSQGIEDSYGGSARVVRNVDIQVPDLPGGGADSNGSLAISGSYLEDWVQTTVGKRPFAPDACVYTRVVRVHYEGAPVAPTAGRPVLYFEAVDGSYSLYPEIGAHFLVTATTHRQETVSPLPPACPDPLPEETEVRQFGYKDLPPASGSGRANGRSIAGTATETDANWPGTWTLTWDLQAVE